MSKQWMKWIAAMALLAAQAAQGEEHPAVKRPFNLPPAVDLSYSIKARQSGFALSGDATVEWRPMPGRYSLAAVTRASILGKVLENRSDGAIDAFGIAPAKFYEKRFRRDPYTTTFDRTASAITFTESKERYSIKGGEQDRATASWQLVAVARAAPEKFTPGSEWSFFVAGRRDAEPWTFKVVGSENVRTGVGDVQAVHLVKAPPSDSQGQVVDIWLAPSLEWYPVRIRFTDSDSESLEQTLSRLTRR